MKKILASILVAAAAFVALAGPASAHTPTITSTCTTVTMNLTQYEAKSTVSVWLGGKLATKAAVFGPDYKQTYLLDKSLTYVVVVDNRGDGVRDEWDRTFTGKADPCVPTTTVVLEHKDLTPVPTTSAPVDYCASLFEFFTANPTAARVDGYDRRCSPAVVHPATPPCVLDGRFDANTPECDRAGTQVVDPPVVIATQVVERPPVLAFTGATTNALLAFGAVLVAAGFALAAFGRKAKS